MKSRRSLISICTMLLLTAAVFGGGGCGGGGSGSLPTSPEDIQPGSQYEGVLSIQEDGNETVLIRTRYEARNIETSPNLDPAVALFVTDEKYLDRTSGKMQSSSNASYLTQDTVKAFLEGTWDASCEGLDDEGVNAREFLDLLAKENMPMDQFFRFYQAMDEPLTDFLNAIDVYSSRLEALDGKDVFNEIESFCDLSDIQLEKYFADVKDVFGTDVDFCSKLADLGLGISGLYHAYVAWQMDQTVSMEDPFYAFLGYLSEVSPLKNGDQDAKIDPVKVGKLGLDVLKFGWDVIKDGKPQMAADGAFTSVLRKDTTGLDYGYAKTNETGTIEYKITDAWIKSWVLIDAKMRGKASYGATNPDFGGQYLPNVQMDVENCYVQWGMNLNINAQVSNVINASSVENPDPEIDVIAKVNAGWLFQSFGQSAYFKAQGSRGISFKGWK